ncbi:hypothetical protein AVEN_264023-1 [Araneus ventricosus]|uniref:Uncharacterized protein n=1 Tax=Araneus ventricosus TaxID=182803 RepID=A0A4Y2RKP6_ARAVE|nr:hypothetical protein AVEN_264023-1 [Araneus ventricosus]
MLRSILYPFPSSPRLVYLRQPCPGLFSCRWDGVSYGCSSTDSPGDPPSLIQGPSEGYKLAFKYLSRRLPLKRPAVDILPVSSMQYLVLLLLAASASANYNYGHLYLLPTYKDYYGGYNGHHYGAYGQDRGTYTPSVSHVTIHYSGRDGNVVGISPNSIPNLGRSEDLTRATPFDVLYTANDAGRQRVKPGLEPAYLYVAQVRLASRLAAPAKAAVPAFRYIPGHPYGTPVIYGYSSGAYTYYSPSVLSPYSYGSYGMYGSYHSEPYGYLYKK